MNDKPAPSEWFKSSYSNNQGGNCVEVARVGGDGMTVRDSKDESRGVLVVSTVPWSALTSTLSANG